MVKSNSPSSILHPLSYLSQRQLFYHFFFCILFQTYTLPLQTCMCGWLGLEGRIIQTALHLAFVALQHILEIFLYVSSYRAACFFLRGCLIAACKKKLYRRFQCAARFGSHRQRELKEVRESFLEMIIL